MQTAVVFAILVGVVTPPIQAENTYELVSDSGSTLFRLDLTAGNIISVLGGTLPQCKQRCDDIETCQSIDYIEALQVCRALRSDDVVAIDDFIQGVFGYKKITPAPTHTPSTTAPSPTPTSFPSQSPTEFNASLTTKAPVTPTPTVIPTSGPTLTAGSPTVSPATPAPSTPPTAAPTRTQVDKYCNLADLIEDATVTFEYAIEASERIEFWFRTLSTSQSAQVCANVCNTHPACVAFVRFEASTKCVMLLKTDGLYGVSPEPALSYVKAIDGTICTPSPTQAPSQAPSSSHPTSHPSPTPTQMPVTLKPTTSPTTLPPTANPTTSLPTSNPTKPPTNAPSTAHPSVSPSTPSPTVSPTTSRPTPAPTLLPSPAPTTSSPTPTPSRVPSASPQESDITTIVTTTTVTLPLCESPDRSDCSKFSVDECLSVPGLDSVCPAFCSVCAAIPEPTTTITPTTSLPTQTPTQSPTQLLTQAPTQIPTLLPTLAPTPLLVLETTTTQSPTGTPTFSPSVVDSSDDTNGSTTTSAPLLAAPSSGSGDKTYIYVGAVLGVILILLLVGVVIFVNCRQGKSSYNKGVESGGTILNEAYDEPEVFDEPNNDGAGGTSKPLSGPPPYRLPQTGRLVDPSTLPAVTSMTVEEFSDGDFMALPQMATGFDGLPGPWDDYAPLNRYRNILPNPVTRVHLQPIGKDKTSTFINANFVGDAYGNPNGYIASQGPTEQTSHDFWRLVWEQHTDAIIMITGLVEGGRNKCFRYWPAGSGAGDSDDTVREAEFTITVTGVKDCGDHTETSMKVTKAVKGSQPETRLVKHFWYRAWPDHGVPTTTQGAVDMLDAVRDYSNDNDKPWIVHCSAGVGRTGTFLAIDIGMQQLMMTGVTSVTSLINHIRHCRGQMVQSPQQARFIHTTLMNFASDYNQAHATVKDNVQRADDIADRFRDKMETTISTANVSLTSHNLVKQSPRWLHERIPRETAQALLYDGAPTTGRFIVAQTHEPHVFTLDVFKSNGALSHHEIKQDRISGVLGVTSIGSDTMLLPSCKTINDVIAKLSRPLESWDTRLKEYVPRGRVVGDSSAHSIQYYAPRTSSSNLQVMTEDTFPIWPGLTREIAEVLLTSASESKAGGRGGDGAGDGVWLLRKGSGGVDTSTTAMTAISVRLQGQVTHHIIDSQAHGNLHDDDEARFAASEGGLYLNKEPTGCTTLAELLNTLHYSPEKLGWPAPLKVSKFVRPWKIGDLVSVQHHASNVRYDALVIDILSAAHGQDVPTARVSYVGYASEHDQFEPITSLLQSIGVQNPAFHAPKFKESQGQVKQRESITKQSSVGASSGNRNVSRAANNHVRFIRNGDDDHDEDEDRTTDDDDDNNNRASASSIVKSLTSFTSTGDREDETTDDDRNDNDNHPTINSNTTNTNNKSNINNRHGSRGREEDDDIQVVSPNASASAQHMEQFHYMAAGRPKLVELHKTGDSFGVDFVSSDSSDGGVFITRVTGAAAATREIYPGMKIVALNGINVERATAFTCYELLDPLTTCEFMVQVDPRGYQKLTRQSPTKPTALDDEPQLHLHRQMSPPLSSTQESQL
eukprot:m.233921 g.233921  ORF g.233921 m.233921 type:complete len:1573 (+) comp33649_c8_seq7:254-4972(+)